MIDSVYTFDMGVLSKVGGSCALGVTTSPVLQTVYLPWHCLECLVHMPYRSPIRFIALPFSMEYPLIALTVYGGITVLYRLWVIIYKSVLRGIWVTP